jgi:hypothetical protein
VEENPFSLALNNDTWTYDLRRNTWEKVETATDPAKRGLHSIIYDAMHKVTVLFGGTDGGEHGRLNDTWLLSL